MPNGNSARTLTPLERRELLKEMENLSFEELGCLLEEPVYLSSS